MRKIVCSLLLLLTSITVLLIKDYPSHADNGDRRIVILDGEPVYFDSMNSGGPVEHVNKMATTEPAVKSVQLFELSDSTFAREVEQFHGTVLVEFSATWCGPCQRLRPVLEAMNGNCPFKIVHADLDITHELVHRFSVTGVPYMMVFKDGVKVADRVGSSDRETLLAWVGQFNTVAPVATPVVAKLVPATPVATPVVAKLVPATPVVATPVVAKLVPATPVVATPVVATPEVTPIVAKSAPAITDILINIADIVDIANMKPVLKSRFVLDRSRQVVRYNNNLIYLDTIENAHPTVVPEDEYVKQQQNPVMGPIAMHE